MRKLWPLSELEFVIDEQPVMIGEAGAVAKEGAEGGDLIGQLSSLLAEKEQLSVTVKLLERRGAVEDEMEKLMRRILPVLDGFERILGAGRGYPDDHPVANWLRSVESLYFRLKNLLDKHGLVEIEPVGQRVNLDLHEVVECRYSPDHEPDTIIAVRQRGYVFRGRLLRDAQVVVATNERS